MVNHSRYVFTFTVCLLLLQACGFHLRGMVALPDQYKSLYIQTSGVTQNTLAALQQSLIANNVTLHSSAELAKVVLKLTDEKNDRRISSTNSNGDINEYLLIQYVTFELTNQKGDVLIEQTTIETRRNYEYDVNNVNSQSELERTYVSEMRRDLVQRILLRFQTASVGTSEVESGTSNTSPKVDFDNY